MTTLGLKGALVHGHTNGVYLANRENWAIFERAEALGVPLYLHPTTPHVVGAFFPHDPNLAIGWGFQAETATYFVQLMFSGVFDAYTRLKILLGHLSEMPPFLYERLDDFTAVLAEQKGLQHTNKNYMKENLLVTTSGNFSTPAFLCTQLSLGVENILFATDFPMESMDRAVSFLHNLPISDMDREKVAHLNAERLLHL